MDIQIALSGPHWHQPICLRFYGYYPGCSALSSHQFFFYNNIKGIKIENDQCKIGQYADDTFLLLEEGDDSLHECLKTFQEFYHCSGLIMNMEKTQVAWIGLSRTVRKKLIQDLSWVEQFRLLVINFDINLESIVDKLCRNYK